MFKVILFTESDYQLNIIVTHIIILLSAINMEKKIIIILAQR